MPTPDDTGHLAPAATDKAPVHVDQPTLTPAGLRADIDATRTRMSRTLDEIEQRLVSRKNELRDTATLRPLRHRLSSEPWRSLLIAFVAGYLVAAVFD